MNNNVIITINSDKRTAVVSPKEIAISGENLQGKLIVEFSDSFVEGFAARLDVLICSSNKKKGYISLKKEGNTYVCDISNKITERPGKIKMQLVVKQDTGTNFPVFKSAIFEVIVEESINATDELD